MISKEMGYYALFLDSEGNRVGTPLDDARSKQKGDPGVPLRWHCFSL